MKDLVYVVAKLQARAGKESALKNELEALIEPTKREKGSRRYSLMQDRSNQAVLTILEEWDTEADLNTHLALPHLQTLFGKLPDMLAAPPDIVRYKQLG